MSLEMMSAPRAAPPIIMNSIGAASISTSKWPPGEHEAAEHHPEDNNEADDWKHG